MNVDDNSPILLWDSLKCKKEFYLKYFNNDEAKKWGIENSAELKLIQAKVLEDIKKSGLTKEEFIKLLQ